MSTVRRMAESLRPELLAGMLESPSRSPSELIIIDCRSFRALANGLIRGANEVHCPPILKRRSGGNIPLENIIRDADARQLLVDGRYTHVIVYDEKTKVLDDLSKDSNMYLVIKTLAEEKSIDKIFYLIGGYQKFKSLYPHLCSGSDAIVAESASTAPTVISSAQGQPPATSAANQRPAAATAAAAAASSQNAAHLLRTRSRTDLEPVEVLPWLFIGSLNHALQLDVLLQLGMSAIISMAASPEACPVASTHFVCKSIPIRDSSTANILQWFPEAIHFIENVRKNHGKVLVHCQAGVSRSATICIAYLMYHKNIGLDEAFNFLKSKRSVISPNFTFMQQLAEFESQLRGDSGRDKPVVFGFGGLTPDSQTKCSSRPGGLLALSPCVQPSRFVYDLPYLPATTASSPIISLPNHLVSPS